MSVLAIITARGGSKRIPKKNIKHFLGKPIIQYSIEAAIQSNIFTEVMVSTDDVEIAEIAKLHGAIVPFYRTQNNSNDFATTAQVIEEVLLKYKEIGKNFDYCCCIYPTAPFVTSSILQNALTLIVESKATSVIPIVQFSFPIMRAVKLNNEGFVEFNWSEYSSTRSQDLDTKYHDCGQFYFIEVCNFLKEKLLFSNKTLPIIMPEAQVQDIDTLEDWKIAELKYSLFNNKNPN